MESAKEERHTANRLVADDISLVVFGGHFYGGVFGLVWVLI